MAHEDGFADERQELLRLRSELLAIKRDIRFRRLLCALKAYNPNQPRVPAGNPEGGQWARDEGLTDISASRRRGPTGRSSDGTPGQQARLAIAEARARDAIRRVRELDPKWRPTPSFRETIEGRIAAAEAEAREADARIAELARNGIGVGPFARESIPARGPERDFNSEEIRKNNRNFEKWGCHTCGSSDPDTRSGNAVLDHQPPTGLNSSGGAQRLYPQCKTCSDLQGGWVRWLMRRR